MNKIYKTLLTLFMAALLSFSSVAPTVAYAADSSSAETVADFDSTAIEDDLQDLFNGKSWNEILDMFPNTTADVQILTFMEYCYSDNPTLLENYGLYLYVYNPTEQNFEETACVANMATSFTADGKAGGFENKKLQFLSSAENGRFLKFKVIDYGNVLTAAESYAETHEGKRRYDIVSFQFYTDPTLNKSGEDKAYGRSYYFSGYALNMHATSADSSTLTSEYDVLETLRLEVQQTNYRTDDFVDYVCDELNTVYFSIPNEVLSKYGDIQSITAEWYEYVTTPIFVTRDEDAYQALKNGYENYGDDDTIVNYWGVDLSGREHTSNTSALWRVVWEEGRYGNSTAKYSCYHGRYNPYAGNEYFSILDTYPQEYHYFKDTCMYPVDTSSQKSQCTNAHRDLVATPRIDWIFYKNIEAGADISEYIVSSKEVHDFMLEYTGVFSTQDKVLDGHGGTYATGLFTDYVDEGRTRGYNVKTIDKGDSDKLLFEQDKSWWDILWTGVGYEDESYAPIVQIQSSDLSKTADEFGRDFYVNSTDSQAVLDYCKDEIADDRTPVLFRFAKTEYYSSEARFDKAGDDYALSSNDGYVSQQTMFLDFDIISLMFKSDGGVETVIGVVSDPFNIINDVTPPPDVYIPADYDEWLELLTLMLGIVAILCFLGFCMPLIKGLGEIIVLILKTILDVLISILSAPFKLFGSLFGSGGKKK